jgi:hypothetical protein
MLSNFTETLHSQRKSKNKQVATIWSLKLKKQRIGTTMYFREGLENTPFNYLAHRKKSWKFEIRSIVLGDCFWWKNHYNQTEKNLVKLVLIRKKSYWFRWASYKFLIL